MTTTTVLDAVATAYADDPTTLQHLLVDLADAVAHAHHTTHDRWATDYGRDYATAAADAARDHLTAALDLPGDTQ